MLAERRAGLDDRACLNLQQHDVSIGGDHGHVDLAMELPAVEDRRPVHAVEHIEAVRKAGFEQLQHIMFALQAACHGPSQWSRRVQYGHGVKRWWGDSAWLFFVASARAVGASGAAARGTAPSAFVRAAAMAVLSGGAVGAT